MSSKFSSSFFKKSPLNVTVATGYVSTRDSLQRMFDDITKGTVKALEGASDPQIQADRLDRRITNRNERAAKKQKKADKLQDITRTKAVDADGNPVIDTKTGLQEVDIKNPGKKLSKRETRKVKRLRDRAEKITEKNKTILTPRYNKAKEKADSDMTKKLEQYEALYNIKNPGGLTYDERKKQIKNSHIREFGQDSWDNLGEKGQLEQYSKYINVVR